MHSKLWLSFAQGNVLVSTHLLLKAIFCAGQRSSFHTLTAQALPAAKLDRLYEDHIICEAVLRSLPPVSKKYVFLLLYIDTAVPAKSLDEWVLSDGLSKHRAALDRLLQLRVFVEVTERKKDGNYRLNPAFQSQLRQVIVNGGAPPREPMPPDVAVRIPSMEELETYALRQWENFLLQLVSSGFEESTSEPFSPSMMKICQRSGLLTLRENETPRLTENGFQFLLMETSSQLWQIIREYISTAEDRGFDAADLISFLLGLSFHIVGQAYNVNTLTKMQQKAVEELAALGIVRVQQGMKERWFIPTKLATSLAANLSDSSSRKQAEGFVVVETNFRVYAYSTSRLHSEILRLFSRLEYQLPNLIVGAITKESLYKAFGNGITGEQIISFLQQHAHPRVAQRIPSVPENVTDQIRLWESDRNRVQLTSAYMYDDFPSEDVFESACTYARDVGGWLWDDTKHRRLVVRAESHQEMREFIRRQNTGSSNRK
ncbi:general transcription and DNA repair factor IIH subunit TFB2 isoform X2 [Cryptomeria japonica]|uniref:general transcription and DNA repair factor IIH subunit TFB2 isoform X2 n=1 Tax=Cryptomeria japonica TaxID=3369 RepID=UPI0025AC21A0|nr:general transcription and DNA repair factor IIH subunit TFB2 isoform X2 [Cryptomeria japonica]